MEEFSQRIILQAGQRLPRYVKPGMQIVAVAGSLRIEGPLSSPDGHMIRTVVALQEGAVHLISDTGWICLSATSAAELICMTGSVEARSLWQSLRAALSLMRRRTASRYGT
ncbi:hypothetical protein [Noviherbaspirillum sp. Root189]|uniref:hypothetical protein n=1 Tax=Noviherbaspirillum sp. Root189 TaxID=1736487 RepID=UPI00070938AA|nr:hypothetical protein [Noviherbaspirillum sp. Root189]KRB79081.1 hypothetical protein ASE07_05185 [Noviherbaspirillum sp. Root189]